MPQVDFSDYLVATFARFMLFVTAIVIVVCRDLSRFVVNIPEIKRRVWHVLI